MAWQYSSPRTQSKGVSPKKGGSSSLWEVSPKKGGGSSLWEVSPKKGSGSRSACLKLILLTLYFVSFFIFISVLHLNFMYMSVSKCRFVQAATEPTEGVGSLEPEVRVTDMGEFPSVGCARTVSPVSH